MTAAYVYPATVDHVIDGDSIMLLLDLGFDLTMRMNCRLDGINARELHDPGGKEARDHLAGMLPPGTPVAVISVGWDKYGGRADVHVTTGQGDLASLLIAEQWAAEWDGAGPRPVPPWPRTVTP